MWRRRALATVLVCELAVTGMGCHQHYYYYTDPCAPSAPISSSVKPGPVCDVPTQIVEGGTTLADGASRSTTVTGGSTTSPRVVVSEPAGTSRYSWRRSDPDGSLASTTVQGTVDDAKVNR
jgi:hypothetical protein